MSPSRPKHIVLVLAALGLGMGVGCGAETSTTHVWQAQVRAPRVAENLIVFAGRMTEPTRRTVEDELVHQLAARGMRATPSYHLFAQLPQRDIAQNEVKRLGFDGAIVATLRQVRERTTYVPGNYAGGFWGGYYGPAWGMGHTWTPGYLATEEVVNLETTYWDLRSDPGDLVWAGNTETRNPTSTRDFIQSYVGETLENLERVGVVRRK
jgi:hypothetical protein